MKNISEAEELDESSENDQHKEKFSAFANRDNSDFKWQRARNVLGVLEIASEPILKPRDEMKPRHNKLRETVFKEALAAWEKEKLRNELVIALETLPVETCCCGLFRDHEETKKELVKLLNEKWTKIANKKLAQHGYVMDNGSYRGCDLASCSTLHSLIQIQN